MALPNLAKTLSTIINSDEPELHIGQLMSVANEILDAAMSVANEILDAAMTLTRDLEAARADLGKANLIVRDLDGTVRKLTRDLAEAKAEIETLKADIQAVTVGYVDEACKAGDFQRENERLTAESAELRGNVTPGPWYAVHAGGEWLIEDAQQIPIAHYFKKEDAELIVRLKRENELRPKALLAFGNGKGHLER